MRTGFAGARARDYAQTVTVIDATLRGSVRLERELALSGICACRYTEVGRRRQGEVERVETSRRAIPPKEFVAKLRRLADCMEQGKRFRIQVAREFISIPPGAIINIEHGRGGTEEEFEFQLKWSLDR